MKVVALRDAKDKLDGLAKTAQGEIVLLTKGGKPFAFLTSAAQYDWEDVEYMSDPSFWRMIAKARKEPTLPIEEVRRQLGLPRFRKRARKTRGKRAG